MKILVTGGAGYIGSHTVKALQLKGHEVVVYDNLSTGHAWAVKDCPLVIGDIADADTLSGVLSTRDFDGVIHFAASSLVGESMTAPGKYYENNVIGTKRLLDTMISNGVKNIVFSSTCAIYGEPETVPITEKEKQPPVNTYGWTKLMIERMMRDYGRAYGLNATALRYFNAAGAAPESGIGEAHSPETHVIPLILAVAEDQRKEFSLFGDNYDTRDGSCIRDYIHVKDLAEVHISAMEEILQGNEAEDGFRYYNVGTGKGTSVYELVSVVEKVTGKKVNLKVRERRGGDPAVLVADSLKVFERLNWRPKHSGMDEIVTDAYRWFKYLNK